MKKLLFTTGLLLVVTTSALARLNPGNDTIVVKKPQKVTVVTTDLLQKITIEGQENDNDYRYDNIIQLVDSNYISNISVNSDRWEFSLPFSLHKRKKQRKIGERDDEISTRIGFGWVGAIGSPENMDVTIGASWEIFWTILQWEYKRCGNPHRWSVGLGLDWRNYRMTNTQRFVKDEKNIVIEKYPDGATPKFSRVKVLSLQIPLLYRYKINEDFSIGAGPILNLNVHSSLKTRYKINDKKHKNTDDDAWATPLTLDFMGIVGTPVATFYVKYSPCNVLRTAHAPKFQSFSLGIYL